MQDVRRLQLGEVVDFCIEYNARQKEAEKQSERRSKAKHYRYATQDEINAFKGR